MIRGLNHAVLYVRDAQAHPEDYKHLLVRVTGYNAYFTSIEPDGTPSFPYNIGRVFYGEPVGNNATIRGVHVESANGDGIVVGDMKHRHRDVKLVGAVVDQRAELVSQEMSVSPAVADDLEPELACLLRFLDRRRIDVPEPGNRQRAGYRETVEETDCRLAEP